VAAPLARGLDIFRAAQRVLDTMPLREPVRLVGVTVANVRPIREQLPLFPVERKVALLTVAMDAVNDKYGEFTLYPAAVLQRSRRTRTIAPAWRPYGVRQSIR
jgi:DNA polymerase-4